MGKWLGQRWGHNSSPDTTESKHYTVYFMCILHLLYFLLILSEFVGFCLSTCLLRIDHKFSMGLRSVDFPGHGPKILMFCSSSHLVTTFALWQGAPSCWKRHCSSPNCSWMVGRSCSWRMCWHHSLFMAVFLGKIVSEPTPLAEKQPHTLMVSGCFTVGMTQDWW